MAFDIELLHLPFFSLPTFFAFPKVSVSTGCTLAYQILSTCTLLASPCQKFLHAVSFFYLCERLITGSAIEGTRQVKKKYDNSHAKHVTIRS